MTCRSIKRAAIIDEEAAESLMIAIIQQAANDYRSLGAMLQISNSRVEKRHIEAKMKTLTAFFLGNWYKTLTGMDNGARVLALLDEEVFRDDRRARIS